MRCSSAVATCTLALAAGPCACRPCMHIMRAVPPKILFLSPCCLRSKHHCGNKPSTPAASLLHRLCGPIQHHTRSAPYKMSQVAGKGALTLGQRFGAWVNSPTGPRTTHFWGPVANWGFVIAVSYCCSPPGRKCCCCNGTLPISVCCMHWYHC